MQCDEISKLISGTSLEFNFAYSMQIELTYGEQLRECKVPKQNKFCRLFVDVNRKYLGDVNVKKEIPNVMKKM